MQPIKGSQTIIATSTTIFRLCCSVCATTMTQQAGNTELLYFEAGGAEADASSRNLFGSPLKRSSPFQGPLSERRRHPAHKTCIEENKRNRGQKQRIERGVVESVLPLCFPPARLRRLDMQIAMPCPLLGRRPQPLRIACLVIAM